MPVIETFGLSKTFKEGKERIAALDSVSVSIDGGQIFGLLGPNGAGKTTLIYILSTLLTPTSGNAEVLGFDLLKQADRIKEKIGICFGGTEFAWNFSVYENLNYYSMLFDLPRQKRIEKINYLADVLNFKHFVNTKFNKLSTGMKQKVAIAKSLLNDPEVIFMDEPTNGLDVEIAIDVRNFLREVVKNTGMTILLTSHNMHEIEVLCRKLALINRGKIIAEGDIKKIKKNLNFPDTVFLEVPRLRDIGFIKNMKLVNNAVQTDNGVLVETYNAQKLLENLLAELRKRKIKLDDIEIRKATLEDAFLKIIGEVK